MPHKRFAWANRIKEAEREYQAVRVAMDWLLEASPDEIHEVVEARGWDDRALAARNAADRNLGATYLIRVYSVFERAVKSFSRMKRLDQDRQVDGDALIDEVGSECKVPIDVIVEAQAVRSHRNRLVHDRIGDFSDLYSIEDARRHLMTYLDYLPEDW